MLDSKHPNQLPAPQQENRLRRRRYQKGSLQVRKHGKKRAWVVLYYDSDGHHRYRTLGPYSAMTKSQAQEEQAKFMTTINGGDGGSDEIRPVLVSEFVNNVYLPFQRGKWKKSTRGTSENTIQHHIVKEMGNLQVEKLTPSFLQDFLNRKAQASPRSYSVIAHLRWHLSSICEMAVAEKIIQANPAKMLYVPREAKPGESRVMTATDVQRAIEAVAFREKVILHLATFSGLRPGEFLALQRCHVSPNGRQMTIIQRVYRGELDLPKNDKPRTVENGPQTAALLVAWMEAAVGPEPTAWVFASESGATPLSRDNLLRRYLRPALSKIGLGWVDFKVTRRTNASIGHDAKIDPKVAADQRGHGIGVSLDVYTKSGEKQKAAAAKRLENAVLSRKVIPIQGEIAS